MAGLKDKRGLIDKERLDLSERHQITASDRKVGRLTKDISAELGKKR